MNRPALSLSMRRLAATFGARLGWLGALVVGLVFAGSAASGDDFTMQGVRALCWVAAGPAALAASRAPSLRDRADGVDLMAGTRGIGDRALRRSRLAAAALGCALRVVVPTVAIAVTALIVSASLVSLARAGGALVGGALAGAVVGLVGAGCGELGKERGRALFAAVVLLPWVLGDVWSVPALSLVGAIDAGLSWVAGAAGTWS